MKIKIEFIDYWFKDKKNGKIMYKGYFHLNDKVTAWVPVSDNVNVGDVVSLTLGRDNEGRVKVMLQHN